jgi:hypothetical protein
MSMTLDSVSARRVRDEVVARRDEVLFEKEGGHWDFLVLEEFRRSEIAHAPERGRARGEWRV